MQSNYVNFIFMWSNIVSLMNSIGIRLSFKKIGILFFLINITLIAASSVVFSQQSKPGANQNSALGFIRVEALIDLDGDGIVDPEDINALPYGDSVLVNVTGPLSYTLLLGSNILGEDILGLGAGTYTITISSQPSGWIATSATTINQTITILDTDTVRFLFFKLIDIGGKKFNDINGNGYFDFDEPTLSGWEFSLDSAHHAFSDSAGNFSFTGIGPGSYQLKEEPQSGWLKTYPANDGYTLIALSGNNIFYQDFGNFELAKFVVQFVIDQDGDGIAEPMDINPLPAGTFANIEVSNDSTINFSVPVGNNSTSSLVPNIGVGTYSFSLTTLPAGWIVTSDTTLERTVSGSGLLDTVRFMAYKLISVQGKKFNDLNGNGVFEFEEPGIPGWEVSLNPFGNTFTDSLGNYSFSNVGPGTFFLSEVQQPGWERTHPASAGYNFTAFSGNDIIEQQFGNFKLGKIRIEVTIDQNGDGVIDSTDHSALPVGEFVQINISKDTSFNYNVSLGNNILSDEVFNVGLGEYHINLTSIPAGWVVTTDTSFTHSISQSGAYDTLRFMLFKLIKLGGKKFHDLNNNGFMDINEPGLAGWSINVNGVENLVTDSAGNYLVENLGPGTYILSEIQQPGWMKTTPANSTITFTAFSGNNALNLNFGNFKLGTISGTKFHDLNNNGQRDSSDYGLANWKIILVGPSPFIAFTDSNGYYEFNNLLPGAYKVSEFYQAGWIQTFPSQLRYTDTISTGGQQLEQRDFGNYQVPNSLSGMKFNDVNANSFKDSSESGLEHWVIRLYDSSRTVAMTDTTDSLGYYSFQNLPNGLYYIREVQQDGWVQTYPRTINILQGTQPGVHTVYVENGVSRTGLDFGNTGACRYIGPPGGAWSNDANWSCGHAPEAGTPIIIPQDTIVVVDSLVSDSIHSVRIQSRGSVHFNTINRTLRIHGSVQIDSGASLSLPTGDSSGLICYGDWLNSGTFDPGTSTIIFSGDSAKTILAGDFADDGAAVGAAKRKGVTDYTANNFYNLVIDGSNTSLIGNLRIENTLEMNQSLATRSEDTIFIQNPNPLAIDSTGIIPRGSIKRAIDQTNGGTYRFESSNTLLTFNAGETLPDSALITTLPDTIPPVFSLKWKVIGGALDTNSNTITIDSIGKFSKWVFGKPGTGLRKGKGSSTQYGTPAINRLYTITTSGGDQFNATLQLRYDEDELIESETQDGLKLLQGPVVAETLKQNWNIVAVPVIPETTYDVNALFPNATSNAFYFISNAGYQVQNELEPGKGYWVKYPANTVVGILGDELTSMTLSLESGWNMIGSLSFPLAVSSITDNGAGISGLFYYFNNGYAIADSLRPMRGYWIKAAATGTITLDVSPLLLSKSSSARSVIENLSTLMLSDNNGNSQTLYFGKEANGNTAAFEMPPPPPSGSFDARFKHNSIAAFTDNNQTRDFPIQLSSAAGEITLSWNNDGNTSIPAEMIINNRAVPLVGKGETSFSSAGSLISLRISPAGSSEETPSVFQLHQNYPNPFNPTTEIRYDIPVEGIVTLKIYNVLGQTVATPIEAQTKKAGRYTETFNRSSLPSGVYFYRITVNESSSASGTSLYQAQKKMILLK